MLEALRALRRNSRSLREDRAIGKLITNPKLRKKFGDELQAKYGWDGTNLQALFKIFLEHLPEIIALIMKLIGG